MSMIPVVASAEEIPAAIAYAEDRRNARWYVSRRAFALGRSDLVPDSWGEAITAGIKPTADHLKSARESLGSKSSSWPVPTGRPGIAQAMAADVEPSVFESQLQDLGALSDQQLSELAGEITQAFEQADSDDDLDAMNQAADAIIEVRAEAARRGVDLTAQPEPVTAAIATRTPPAPRVAADRQPRGTGPKRTGNTVVSARGEVPGWSSLVDYVEPSGKGRQANAEAEAENARRVTRAKEADRRMSREAEAAAMAAARVDPTAIIWPPFIWLREAAEQNPGAPAWAVTAWLNALCGPAAVIAPLPAEQLAVSAGASGMFAYARSYWRVAWGLCEALAGQRHNVMPDPGLARKPDFRAPECSWVATDEGLLAALIELQTGPDPSVCVKDNRLTGDTPIARLAAMILGPRRGDRDGDNGAMASYGPQSRMASFAEQLRGGAPEPVDLSVLGELSAEQRAALAALVTVPS